MDCNAVRPRRPESRLRRFCAGLLCGVAIVVCFFSLRRPHRGGEGSAQSGYVGVPCDRAPSIHSLPPSRHSLRVRLTCTTPKIVW